MNPARVAALLRELADELEGTEAPAESKPTHRRRKAPPLPIAPSGEVDDVSRARARRLLRGKGLA